MAARKKKRGLRPRIPSRVKRRTSAKPKRGRPHGHHSELWGLGLVALGLFLAVVLYGGWNGGLVGGPAADAVHGLVGVAAYVVPLALLGVGGLMVARSELVDFRPFRIGLVVLAFGLLTTLGSAHGGFLGDVFGGGLRKLLGPGAAILGVLALVIGALLLTGASVGRARPPLAPGRAPRGEAAAASGRRSARLGAEAEAQGRDEAAARRRPGVPGRRRRRRPAAAARPARAPRRGSADALRRHRPERGARRVRPARPQPAPQVAVERQGGSRRSRPDRRGARPDARALRHRRDARRRASPARASRATSCSSRPARRCRRSPR